MDLPEVVCCIRGIHSLIQEQNAMGMVISKVNKPGAIELQLSGTNNLSQKPACGV